MHTMWSLYALFGMNAWVWSTVFHARDWRSTELLDYLCSDLFVIFTLVTTIVKVFRLKSLFSILGVVTVLGGFFLYHLHYMLYVLFDYWYNTLVAIVVGAFETLLWFGWVAYYRRPYSWKIVLSHIGMWIASSMEIWDFPPYLGIFDAHSLWHASTVPLCYLLYSFIIDDALYEIEEQKRKQL